MPASDWTITKRQCVPRGAVLLSLATICWRASTMLAGVATIPIVQDTRIDSYDTTTNYGGESSVKIIKNSVSHSGGSMVRGLIALPHLPDIAVDDVCSAKIWLCETRYSGPSDEGPYTRGITLYPLTQAFDQNTATWQNCNGGQYDSSHPVRWSPAPGIVGGVDWQWWCSWDIRPLWDNNNLRNNGALLVLDPETPPSTSYITKAFAASDHPVAEYHPFVEVVTLDQWNGLSGDWMVPEHWASGTAPNVVDAVAGFLGKATQDQTVTVDAPVTLGAILFDNAHKYTLTGTNGIPIAMNRLSGTAAITVNHGTHEIAAPMELATNTTVTVANVADNLTLSGGISGMDTGLTKQGSGTLVLSGENTYDGGTSVLAGTLNFGNLLALPPGSNVTVGAGGVIVFSSGYTGPITSGGEVQSAAAVAVPEPGTFALLAAGTLAAVMVGRCARRRTVSQRVLRGGAPRLSGHGSARYNWYDRLYVGSSPTRTVHGNLFRKDG